MNNRIFSYALTVVLTLGAMTGCNKDKPVGVKPSGLLAVNLKADIGPSSRLKVTGSGEWETSDRLGLYMKQAGDALSASAVYSAGANIEMSIDGDRLSSTPSLFYPLSGNVDFIAYYPYTSAVSPAYTIDVNVAEQAAIVETLYSNNIEAQAPTTDPVTLNFKYPMAKLVVTVKGSEGFELSPSELNAMGVSVNSMFTQAKLNLADGTFIEHQSPANIALLKRGEATTSVVFEALVFPVAVGARTFVFQIGGVSYPYVVNEAFNAATEYRFNFTLNAANAVRTVTLLDATILPRNAVTREYELVGERSGYLKLLPTTANGMTVTRMYDNYHYLATAAGSNAYVHTDGLSATNHADSVVLTFHYKSDKDIPFVQLFFSDPISEGRSVKSDMLYASSTWAEWSIVLKSQLLEYSWGNLGQYLRLLFGGSGYSIELRDIHFRGMTPVERKAEAAKNNLPINNTEFNSRLVSYLATTYSSQITEVNAGANSIAVTGNYSGAAGNYYLCEVTPYQDVLKMSYFPYCRKLNSSSFTETFERYVRRDGFMYDRTLSKWLIAKESVDGNSDEIISHARYADNIVASQNLPKVNLTSKKGIGAYYTRHAGSQYSDLMRDDLDELGITSVTVNIYLNQFFLGSQPNYSISHEYGGKTYYMSPNVVYDMDSWMKDCYHRNIVVAAIILLEPANSWSDQSMGQLLQHPSFPGSHSTAHFTMPNMTSAESVNAYAAALDFLAKRYSRPDALYGRVHHWIMHNEANIGYQWTNMGSGVPMNVYTDTYMKSMRMCYNIVRRYDQNSEVFASFTKSWRQRDGDNSDSYIGFNQIYCINDYCRTEGDFQWALAFHSYPNNLTEPRIWNEGANVSYSYSTPYVTFKNLEVLDYWAKQPENKYKGSIKRSVWLSENGLGSREPGVFILPPSQETTWNEQAAGLAWTWLKLNQLDGIDAMQYHNWEDTAFEDGIRLGLRRSIDNNLVTKPIWNVYKAAGTAQQNSVFVQYQSLSGMTGWGVIQTIP